MNWRSLVSIILATLTLPQAKAAERVHSTLGGVLSEERTMSGTSERGRFEFVDRDRLLLSWVNQEDRLKHFEKKWIVVTHCKLNADSTDADPLGHVLRGNIRTISKIAFHSLTEGDSRYQSDIGYFVSHSRIEDREGDNFEIVGLRSDALFGHTELPGGVKTRRSLAADFRVQRSLFRDRWGGAWVARYQLLQPLWQDAGGHRRTEQHFSLRYRTSDLDLLGEASRTDRSLAVRVGLQLNDLGRIPARLIRHQAHSDGQTPRTGVAK